MVRGRSSTYALAFRGRRRKMPFRSFPRHHSAAVDRGHRRQPRARRRTDVPRAFRLAIRSPMPSLRQLLELRQAYPLSWSPDGSTLLVASDLPGTRQLFALPADGGEIEQLTDYAEPVSGFYLPTGGSSSRSTRPGTSGRSSTSSARAARQRSALQPLDAARLPRRKAPRVHDEPPQRARLRRNRPRAREHRRRLDGAGQEREAAASPAPERKARSGRSSSAATSDVDSISPDGRWVVAVRGNERAGDYDLFLLDIASGEVVHATPHSDAAEYGSTVWSADSSGFFASTNEGRDTLAIAHYDVATGEWRVTCRVGLGSHVLRRRRWPEPRRRRERGRLLAEQRRRVPGRRRRGALRLLAGRREGRVWLLDDERAARRCGCTTSRPASRRAGSPSPGRSRRRRADAPPLRELRRRVDPRLPLRPAGRGPFPVVVTIHGGPEGAMAAVVLAGFGALTQHPRLARLRGRGAERPRLERLRQALPEPRRRGEAPRLRRRSRLAARVARRAAGDRRLAPGRLRPLVRRLHGARGARVPARAVGCGPRVRRDLEPPHLPREHVGVPARRARARVRLALRPRPPRRGSRRGAGSARSARRSSSSTAATTRACRSASRRRSTASSSTAASAASS